MPYSSGGRPATALRPMLGTSMPSKRPDVGAVVLAHDVGRERLVLRREVAFEQVGGFDDVVVDADDDHVVDLHDVLLVAAPCSARVARLASAAISAVCVRVTADGPADGPASHWALRWLRARRATLRTIVPRVAKSPIRRVRSTRIGDAGERHGSTGCRQRTCDWGPMAKATDRRAGECEPVGGRRRPRSCRRARTGRGAVAPADSAPGATSAAPRAEAQAPRPADRAPACSTSPTNEWRLDRGDRPRRRTFLARRRRRRCSRSRPTTGR